MTFSRTSPSRGPSSAEVTGFYDEDTGSIQYLAADPTSRKAALIDVVMPFDPAHAATDPASVDNILRWATGEGYQIEWILDTHPHADHLMASSYLRDKLGAPNAIGQQVQEIAGLWRDFYNLPGAFHPTRDFSRLFADGETFEIGELPVRVMLSAGHTLGSVTYVVGRDAAFVHDTFMMPDAGTARADFPGGSARELYQSLMALLELPDDCRLFIGHDYGGTYRKEPAWEASVAEHRRHNIHIGGGVSEEEFVQRREARDDTLGLPDRMLHVLQMNLCAGRWPEPEGDGHSYLKIPMNRF